MFGSTAAPSFSFGGQAAGSSSTPSFGSSAGTAAPVFGASSTPSFGSAFGSSAPPFSSTTTAVPSFGSSSSAPAFGSSSTTSAFGSSATPSFGTSSTPAFGSTNTTPAFGSTNAAPAFGAASNTSSFGASGTFGTSTTPAFSSTSSTPAFGSASSTPSFGGFGSATGATPAFGSSSTPAFGSTSNAFGSTAGGFGSFGAASKPAAAAGFGGFGSFGAAASTPSAFGQASTAPTFNLGGQQGGGFGMMNNALAAAPTAPLHPIFQAIQKVASAYAPLKDPSGRTFLSEKEVGQNTTYSWNEECKFKAVFFSRKEQQTHAPQSILALTNPMFEEAERMNADPDKYTAVELSGAEALGKKYEQQREEGEKLAKQIEQVQGILKVAREGHSQLEARVELLSVRQRTLMQHLLRTMRKMQVIRCQGSPLQVNEMKYKERMRSLLAKLEQPFRLLQELSVTIALQSWQEDKFEENVAEEDVEVLVQALKRQSEGLETLTEMMRKDLRDIDLMKAKLPHRHTL